MAGSSSNLKGRSRQNNHHSNVRGSSNAILQRSFDRTRRELGRLGIKLPKETTVDKTRN